jgi:hypothetical protein
VQYGQVPRIPFQNVIEQLQHVDDPDVLVKVKGNLALRLALDMSRPVNWRGTGLKPKDILAVATESGIPVAWVPPPSVLRMLVCTAPADRISVLRARTADVLNQCTKLLAECRDGWLGDDPVLVKRAIDALKAGHHEAAMALAVAVGESLARWASEERVHIFKSEADRNAWEKERKKNKYGLAALELAAVGTRQELERIEVLRHALIGPIPRFFAPFHAKPGELIPETVSRHATVHRPTVSHLTPENALLAIMLCISILREQQAWCEEREAEEAHAQWLAQEG